MSTNSSKQEHFIVLISAAELTDSTASVKVTSVLLDNKKNRKKEYNLRGRKSTTVEERLQPNYRGKAIQLKTLHLNI